MSDAYVGEIRPFGFNFAPVNWAMCNGATMAIDQNEVLYVLIGTTYGGDGQTTFNLPDLRSRFPIHFGQRTGSSNYVLAQTGGSESITLSPTQMPAHSHGLQCSSAAGNSRSPVGAVFAQEKSSQALPYSDRIPANATLDVDLTNITVGGASHENRPPYQAVNFCIALQGIFPSQN